MSDDKVISMEDFKKTERELNNEAPPEEDFMGYTKVVVALSDGVVLTVVEQGVKDEHGEDEVISGIALDYEELLSVMEQLEMCKSKMEEVQGGEIFEPLE